MRRGGCRKRSGAKHLGSSTSDPVPSATGLAYEHVSASLYESRLRQARSTLESERTKQAKEEQKAAKLAGEAAGLRKRASSASAENMRAGYLKQAEGKERDEGKARTAAAKHSAEVAKAQTKIHDTDSKLRAAQAADQRRAADKARQQAKQRERDERREQDREDREERRRRDADERAAAEQAQQLSDLQQETFGLRARLEDVARQDAPSEITVLFLAASPEDEVHLRLDKEIREIEQRLRQAEYRDSIRFVPKVARQLTDLIQDLNETRPHIVHFSGHGNQAELAFENAEGRAQPLNNEMLGVVLAATSDRIRLAVFNSCQSAAQAELATEHVSFAIGMETSVEDERAKTFAAQFYNSLGFGKTLAEAFDQAKAQVALSHKDGGDIPQLFEAPGEDPATTVLVAPDRAHAGG